MLSFAGEHRALLPDKGEFERWPLFLSQMTSPSSVWRGCWPTSSTWTRGALDPRPHNDMAHLRGHATQGTLPATHLVEALARWPGTWPA